MLSRRPVAERRHFGRVLCGLTCPLRYAPSESVAAGTTQRLDSGLLGTTEQKSPCLCVGIDLLHFLIIEVCVYDLFPSAVGGGAAGPFAVSDQCGRGDQDIRRHEYDQDPGCYVSCNLRDLLYPAGKVRIKSFDPDNSGNSPEEAVEKIDSSAQVKGDLAVIPEYLSKYEFCKNTADVFIGSSKKGSDEKESAGRRWFL